MRTLRHRANVHPSLEDRRARRSARQGSEVFRGKGVYISGRSVLRGFWYNKHIIAKWNRPDQVLMGMRWNYYMGRSLHLPAISLLDGHLPQAARREEESKWQDADSRHIRDDKTAEGMLSQPWEHAARSVRGHAAPGECAIPHDGQWMRLPSAWEDSTRHFPIHIPVPDFPVSDALQLPALVKGPESHQITWQTGGWAAGGTGRIAGTSSARPLAPWPVSTEIAPPCPNDACTTDFTAHASATRIPEETQPLPPPLLQRVVERISCGLGIRLPRPEAAHGIFGKKAADEPPKRSVTNLHASALPRISMHARAAVASRNSMATEMPPTRPLQAPNGIVPGQAVDLAPAANAGAADASIPQQEPPGERRPGYFASAVKKTFQLKVARADALPPQ